MKNSKNKTQSIQNTNFIEIKQIDGTSKPLHLSIDILKDNLKNILEQEEDFPDSMKNKKYFFIIITDLDKHKENTVKLEDLNVLEQELKSVILSAFGHDDKRFHFFFIANINQYEHWLQFCIHKNRSNKNIKKGKEKDSLIEYIHVKKLWSEHFAWNHKQFKNDFNEGYPDKSFLKSHTESMDYSVLNISEHFYSDFPRLIDYISSNIGEYPAYFK